MLDNAYILELVYNNNGLFHVQTSQMFLAGDLKKTKNQKTTIRRKKINNPWLLTLMKTERALEEQSANLVKPWEMRSLPKLSAISLLAAWREAQEKLKSRRDAVS